MCKQKSASFVEVIAEIVDRNGVSAELKSLVEMGIPAIAHGVGLGIASADGVDFRRVDMLARVGRELNSPLVSEHVAFTRAVVDGKSVEAGHMLPIPRTEESLGILVRNVRQVQDRLDVPLALEQIATLADPGGMLSEAEFLSELVSETGVKLILDVANAAANAVNHGSDVMDFLSNFPLHAVAYCHVAGGYFGTDGLYRDSHTRALGDEVYWLVSEVVAACRRQEFSVPPMMLERDGDFPLAAELEDELRALHDALVQDGPAAQSSLDRPHRTRDGADSRSIGNAQLGLRQWQQEVVGVLRCGHDAPTGWDPDAVLGMRELLARKATSIHRPSTRWSRLIGKFKR